VVAKYKEGEPVAAYSFSTVCCRDFHTAQGIYGRRGGNGGISVTQQYSEEQPNKRGVLVVRRVEQGSYAKRME